MFGREVADGMTHRVVFTQEGGNWTVVAPDDPPAHSWGPTLESAAAHIKESIALVRDLPAGSEEKMTLVPEFILEQGDGDVFARALTARRALWASQAEADDALKEAVAEGRRLGLSLRDIAAMSGVSHQRVNQLAGR